MNKVFRHCFSISAVCFFTILIYFPAAGTPLNAQSSPFPEAVRDKVPAGIPAEAWEKVRQALDQDGPGKAWSAGALASTNRVTQKAGLLASGPDQHDQSGCSVAISGDTVVVGSSGKDSWAGADSGAAYIFERNAGGAENWGLVRKLTAGDPAGDDNFGYSVAISGDTVVVGAYLKNMGAGIQSGAAYIFERNDGGAENWGQVRKLIAGDPAARDYFGGSVAISGDTAVVGAFSKNDATGAAYIFERNNGGAGNWGQVQKLSAGDPANGDYFGVSVAIGGDAAVVGANQKDSWAGLHKSGAAYVFERHAGGAGNWGQTRKLTPADSAADDRFGNSVAISGGTVTVGASWKGAAYIFERNAGSAGNWGQVRKLTSGDPATSFWFGNSVATSGDTVAVGDYGNMAVYIFARNAGGAGNWGQVRKQCPALSVRFGDSLGISGDTVVAGDYVAGTAYIFERNNGGPENWGEWGNLIVIEPLPGDQFGFATAIHQDLALVGAPYRDIPPGNTNYGKACLFSRNQGGTDHWSWIKNFYAPDIERHVEDWFGFSAALGEEFAFVGTPLQDNALGQDAGAVYVYRRDQDGPNHWGYFKKLTAGDGAAGDQFGISMALSGDTLVVGAWWKVLLAGSAYVFQRHQGGTDNWGQVQKLVASDWAFGDLFGKSVAISGDVVVVGAYGNDDSGESSGSAYIFERNQGGSNLWGQVKKLTALDAGQGDNFGWAVGAAGDWVAVGAPKDDDRGQDAGAVYLFLRNQGGQNLWGQSKKITVADGAPGDYFGTSLSLNDERLLVGADGKNIAGAASGAAYLFQRHEGGTDNWGLATRLAPNDSAAQDKFGFSVALNGDNYLIGAAGKNLGGPEAGAAYIFQTNRALFLPLILKN